MGVEQIMFEKLFLTTLTELDLLLLILVHLVEAEQNDFF